MFWRIRQGNTISLSCFNLNLTAITNAIMTSRRCYSQFNSIMIRRYEVAMIKKTQQFFEVLEELEQEVVAVVHRLMKSRLLMEAIVNGLPFTKETIKSPEILNYVIAITHSIPWKKSQMNVN